MRFFKLFSFLFVALFVFYVHAYTSHQRSQLLSKGFTLDQIEETERYLSEMEGSLTSAESEAYSASVADEESKLGRKLTKKEKATIEGEVKRESRGLYITENIQSVMAAASEAIKEDIEQTKRDEEEMESSWYYQAGKYFNEHPGVVDTIKTISQTGCWLVGGSVGGIATIYTGGVGGLAAGGLAKNACDEAFGLKDDTATFTKILRAFSTNNGCWFCPIFATLFDTINTMASALSVTLKSYCVGLLWLGLLFYILFKVMMSFLSFGAIDPKKFFMDLLVPFMKAIVALIVIYNLGSFYTHIVSPLAELSIGFSGEIQTTVKNNNLLPDLLTISGTRMNGTNVSKLCTASEVKVTENEIGLSRNVNNAIQCFLMQESASLMKDLAIAATFISDSFKNLTAGIFPHWSMLGVGVVMFIGCFMIFLIFPFKLIDAMVRLMFVCALMPLWVILWVLPVTRQYSVKAFNMFLHALVNFIVLSIILTMILIILDSALGMTDSEQNTFVNLLFDGKTEDAFKKIDFSTLTFFIFVAMMFLCNELLK